MDKDSYNYNKAKIWDIQDNLKDQLQKWSPLSSLNCSISPIDITDIYWVQALLQIF